MATKKQEIDVGNYIVNSKNVIGLGSFGIIFTARDKANTSIAVKRIDLADKQNAEQLVEDLNALVPLSHPNILKYFDIVVEEAICWMFMEFCSCGDFGKFFASAGLNEHQILDAMIQTAEGVEYLHSKNIVHRDIKPANILVANASPLRLKLTDFDMSKFLGENYDTSRMSSNVGTAAFKAPEFYLRNDQKKLAYHRNVDIYALGLTFLAMIQGNKPLVPRLETAQYDSEIHNSIGSTMATRLRYGVKPLTVIVPNGDSLLLQSSKSASATDRKICQPVTEGLRCLVLWMTHIKPEKRPTAGEVLQIALKLRNSDTEYVPDLLEALRNDDDGNFEDRDVALWQRQESSGPLPVLKEKLRETVQNWFKNPQKSHTSKVTFPHIPPKWPNWKPPVEGKYSRHRSVP